MSTKFEAVEAAEEARYQSYLKLNRCFVVKDMSDNELSIPLFDMDEAKEFGRECNIGFFKVTNTTTNETITVDPDEIWDN